MSQPRCSLLVFGPPGAGKTSFVRSFLARAHGPGLDVCRDSVGTTGVESVAAEGMGVEVYDTPGMTWAGSFAYSESRNEVRFLSGSSSDEHFARDVETVNACIGRAVCLNVLVVREGADTGQVSDQVTLIRRLTRSPVVGLVNGQAIESLVHSLGAIGVPWRVLDVWNCTPVQIGEFFAWAEQFRRFFDKHVCRLAEIRRLRLEQVHGQLKVFASKWALLLDGASRGGASHVLPEDEARDLPTLLSDQEATRGIVGTVDGLRECFREALDSAIRVSGIDCGSGPLSCSTQLNAGDEHTTRRHALPDYAQRLCTAKLTSIQSVPDAWVTARDERATDWPYFWQKRRQVLVEPTRTYLDHCFAMPLMLAVTAFQHGVASEANPPTNFQVTEGCWDRHRAFVSLFKRRIEESSPEDVLLCWKSLKDKWDELRETRGS